MSALGQKRTLSPALEVFGLGGPLVSQNQHGGAFRAIKNAPGGHVLDAQGLAINLEMTRLGCVMHHDNGRSVSECQVNQAKLGPLPRFGRRLAAGSAADGITSFKNPTRALSSATLRSSGECELKGAHAS